MIIRVANVLIQRFLPEHTDLLYELVNHPSVRQGMSNKTEITYADHLTWVKENLLLETDTHLFVAEHVNYGRGVVLIKNMSRDAGELGIMVDDISGARQTQFVSKLITGILFYAFEQCHLSRLDMNIVPSNQSSLNLAKKIGAHYQFADTVYQRFLLNDQTYRSSRRHQLLIARYQPVIESGLGIRMQGEEEAIIDQ